MSTLNPKKKSFVLTDHERVREKALLVTCLVVCVGFFVKIVLL